MKFWVGACALLVGLAGCSGKGPNTDFAELRGAAATKSAVGQLPKLQLGRTAAQSVANAPDRGALVSYQNKGAPTKREGAYTWYPVAISEEHALKAVVTGEMTVPSPDGSQVKLRYERHEEHPDGNWTWVGRVEGGDPNQEAILTFGEKAVYGSIPQANGAPLSLQTRNGVLWAVETDLSKVKNPNTSNDMMVPPALALREAVAAKATQSAVTQSAVAASAPATAANTIDVAIGYTQGFAAAQGSASAAVTRLTYLIQVGNQAYTNSQINGYLRLVSAVQVTYADNTKNSDALNQLTGYNIAVPAALAPIRTARDQYGADLAVLVRKFQTPENDGCGIAWLNGANQQPIDPALDDDYGFAVISDGDDQGTDGNSYFCAPETLVHELGHLMGSAHDRDNSRINASQPPGGTNLQYGRYAYSFGMKTDSANGNFYTIMAYGDNNQNFYRTFSNPLVLKCGPSANLACGVTDQTDNARSLNQTIPVVAQFRNAVVPFLGGRHDINADRMDDVVWFSSSLSRYGYWLMNGSSVTHGPNFTAAAGFTIAAMGDFNGDGSMDLFWASPSRDLWIVAGNGTGGFSSGRLIATYPAEWRIVSSGDVNGDGIDDLIWFNATGRQYGYWLMNAEGTVRSVYSAAAGPGYNLVTTGDFNGDGFMDMIWVGASNDIILLASNGSTFSDHRIGTYADQGRIFAAGDVDGDGIDDLLLLNKTTNNWGYWLMNGAKITSSRGFAAASGYTPATVGDFNGDGKTDVIWTSAARDMQLNIGDGATFTSASLGTYTSAWRPIDTHVTP